MSTFIIIGNILSLVSYIFVFAETRTSIKKHLLLYQSSNCVAGILAYAFLRANTGIVTALCALIRNILTLTNKFNKKLLLIAYSIIIIALGIRFNNNGIIGYIPIFNSLFLNVILVYIEDIIIIKKTYLGINALKIVYAIFIKDYIAIILSCILIISASQFLYSSRKIRLKEVNAQDALNSQSLISRERISDLLSDTNQ